MLICTKHFSRMKALMSDWFTEHLACERAQVHQGPVPQANAQRSSHANHPSHSRPPQPTTPPADRLINNRAQGTHQPLSSLTAL
jgi:hypothetical protein